MSVVCLVRRNEIMRNVHLIYVSLFRVLAFQNKTQLWATICSYNPNYLLQHLPQEVTDTANFVAASPCETQSTLCTVVNSIFYMRVRSLLSLGTSKGQSNTGVRSILDLYSDQAGSRSKICGDNRWPLILLQGQESAAFKPRSPSTACCSEWELKSVGTENSVRCGSTVTAAPVLPWSSKLIQLKLARLGLTTDTARNPPEIWSNWLSVLSLLPSLPQPAACCVFTCQLLFAIFWFPLTDLLPPATQTQLCLPPVSGAAHRGQGRRPTGADLRAVCTGRALFGREELKCWSSSTFLIHVR